MNEKSLFNSNPSNPYSSVSPAKFSSLEDMNIEAQQVLEQKRKELESYQSTVAQAEKILSDLKQQIIDKTEELKKLSSEEYTEIDDTEQVHAEHEINILEQKHSEEIQLLKSKHEEEMHSLKLDFQQTLQEAENWASQHSSIALQEKLDELEALRKEADSTKRQLDEQTFITLKTPEMKESDEDLKKSASEIAALENQISEITAITREELRDSRAKIEECIVAIDLRKQAHETELKKLDDEILQRRESYETHILTLKEQFELEKQTAEQMISAANERSESTERIIKQLEKHHESQLEEVLGDIETMRRSTGGNSSRPRASNEEMKSLIRESYRIQEEIRALDDETRIVDQEIFELDHENKELKEELRRLEGILHRKGF